MHKKLFTLFLILITAIAVSQNYKGTIEGINESGFHKILLSQEARSASLSNLNYFRILDSKKNDVPYVLINEESTMKSTFSAFTFQTINNVKDSITTIIIENKNNLKQDCFFFKMANTKLKKTFAISGSNDKKEWYGLATNQLFLGLNEAEKTAVEQ